MSENEYDQKNPMTGARQTMASWSKLIESYDAIPEAYKSFFKPYADMGRELPYTILSPSLEKFLHRSTEKLTYDLDDSIHVLERSGNRVTKKSFPYKNIQMLEIGNVLLTSWITINGVTCEGTPGASTIDFNAATGERLFAPFLKKMRPSPVEDADFATEKNKFDFLAESNFKFMNYGRNSLVSGEKVFQVVLQPEIRDLVWKFANWTLYKTITMAHLAILTDKEIILIRDDERGQEVKGVRYGGVWQYISLKKIRSVKLTEISDALLALVITLPFGDAPKGVFRVSSKTELEQFRDKIKEMTG